MRVIQTHAIGFGDFKVSLFAEILQNWVDDYGVIAWHDDYYIEVESLQCSNVAALLSRL